MKLKKKKNLSIKDLITPKAKLTFLVGAGCSVDTPSCLPAGRTMMDAIIDYTCVESEIPKIKELKELRFEQLVEIVSEHLDPELKVIDFYGLCDKPNLQHIFLAEMMKQGQFVITTNFDFLIEHALQKSGVPKEEIKVVITKDDFEQLSNPQELYSHGLKALYKIHGSTRNQITQKDTRQSLVATIQAFGANKEGENVFQLENFKQSAFVNLTKGRSLVVMGYSGSDDFDIVPTLKVLEHIHDIIWINYVPNDGGQESVYEITTKDINDDTISRKVDQILVAIKRMNYAKRVFRVDVNTTRIIKELIPSEIKISPDAFTTDAYQWLSTNIEAPTKFWKLSIPYRIYFDFDRYSDALPLLNKILRIAEEERKKEWKVFALNGMGLIYESQGAYPKALKLYEEALQISEQLGDLSGKAAILNNIGNIYEAQGDYQKALKLLEEAIQINEQLGDMKKKATYISNIGHIYFDQRNFPESLKQYEEALQIVEKLGDLSGKARILSSIGNIYEVQGALLKAWRLFDEAILIDEKLGDLTGKAVNLSRIGRIFYALGRREGDISFARGNYTKALLYFQDSLKIFEQLNELPEIASMLWRIGSIYSKFYDAYQAPLSKVLDNFERALEIYEQLGLENKAQKVRNLISDLKS